MPEMFALEVEKPQNTTELLQNNYIRRLLKLCLKCLHLRSQKPQSITESLQIII